MGKNKPAGEAKTEEAAAAAATTEATPATAATDAGDTKDEANAAPASDAAAAVSADSGDESDDKDLEEEEPSFAPRTYNLKAPDGTCSIGVEGVTVKVPKDGIVKGVPHAIASELIAKHGFTAVTD